MSENTPSQAEGEPDTGAPEADQPPRTTPSQAEGEDPADESAADDGDDDSEDHEEKGEQARHGGKPGVSQHLREEPKTPIHEEFDR